MDAAEAEHVIATYREIAAHFGLKGPVQARVKAKRAGWKAEAQNHPADPLRIRVPRDAWNGGYQSNVVSLPRPAREPRNPPSPTPDLKAEIGGIAKGFETALETLREQLDRERERADRAEARAGQAEAERDAARGELATWTAGGPLARAVRAFLNRRGQG